jgi:hypothetical protein
MVTRLEIKGAKKEILDGTGNSTGVKHGSPDESGR